MKHEVRKICSVCKKDLGVSDIKINTPGQITHSHCPADSDCTINYVKEQMAEIEEMRNENSN